MDALIGLNVLLGGGDANLDSEFLSGEYDVLALGLIEVYELETAAADGSEDPEYLMASANSA